MLSMKVHKNCEKKNESEKLTIFHNLQCGELRNKKVIANMYLRALIALNMYWGHRVQYRNSHQVSKFSINNVG